MSVSSGWSAQHFSQTNPAGPGQDDAAALLRRVADTVAELGEVNILDILMHVEVTEDGYWPSITCTTRPIDRHGTCPCFPNDRETTGRRRRSGDPHPNNAEPGPALGKRPARHALRVPRTFGASPASSMSWVRSRSRCVGSGAAARCGVGSVCAGGCWVCRPLTTTPRSRPR
jgi:hypothetical protein